jgi:uncharacterized cupin superfamily protein
MLKADLTVDYKFEYYMYGHFSKFIPRGSVRICSTPGDYSFSNVAFKNLVFIDDDIVEPNMRIKEHEDEWDEFYYILQGEGEIKVGEELKKVREGDLIFIPRETVHSLKNTKKRPLRFICVAVRI